MTHATLLRLDEFFFEARDLRYAVFKPFDPSSYVPGSDVDVICDDLVELAHAVLRVGNRYIDGGYEIEVKERAAGRQVYIDFWRDSRLDFRFDIYEGLPQYKQVRLKASYAERILADRVGEPRDCEGQTYPFYRQCELDELVLCYVEYFEWYHLRPDKIKHLDYIFNRTRDDAQLLDFLKRLHWYTDLPDSIGVSRSALQPPSANGVSSLDSVPFRRLVRASLGRIKRGLAWRARSALSLGRNRQS